MLLGMCDTRNSMQQIGHNLEESSSAHTRDDLEHLEGLLFDPGFQDFLQFESVEDIFGSCAFPSADRQESSGLVLATSGTNKVKCCPQTGLTRSSGQQGTSPQPPAIPSSTCWHQANETHTISCYQQQQQPQPLQQPHRSDSIRQSREGHIVAKPFHPYNQPLAASTDPTASTRGVYNSRGDSVYHPVHQHLLKGNTTGLVRPMSSSTIQVVRGTSPHEQSFPRLSHIYQSTADVGPRQPFGLGLPSSYQLPKKATPKLYDILNTSSSGAQRRNLANVVHKDCFNPAVVSSSSFCEPAHTGQGPDSSASKTIDSSQSQSILLTDCMQQDLSQQQTDPGCVISAEGYGQISSEKHAASSAVFQQPSCSSSYTTAASASDPQLHTECSNYPPATPLGSSSSSIDTSQGFSMNPMAQPSNVEAADDFSSFDMADSESYCDSHMELDQDGRRQQKLNHSEIEKRRRDKMNAYIMELAALVPMCRDLNRKLDKLSVLRMTVQHFKALRGSCNTVTEVSHLPSFLPEEGVKDVILKASEGFTFAVSCDRGKILFVSESVADMLSYKPGEMTGQNLFDFIHQRDIQKVKDQLAVAEFLPKEKYIDAKTMKLVKTSIPSVQSKLSTGSRRLFVCRMKKKTETSSSSSLSQPPHSDSDFKVPYAVKNTNTSTSSSSTSSSSVATAAASQDHSQELNKSQGKSKLDNSFVMVRCTGYIRQKMATRFVIEEEEDQADADPVNLHCLIAVAIPAKITDPESVQSNSQSTIAPDNITLRSGNPEFMSRHSLDGKFVYVDHRVTGVLGYVPQEMIGTSIYEYCHPDYIQSLSHVHKAVLKNLKKLHNQLHKFRTRDGASVMLSTTMFVFINPWTKESEQLICTHQLTSSAATSNFVTSSTNEKKQKRSSGGQPQPRQQPEQSAESSEVPVNLAYLESEEKKVTSSSDTDVEPSNGKLETVEVKQHLPPCNISQIGRDIMAEVSRQQGMRRNSNLAYASDSSSCQESSSGAENTDEAAMSIIMNLLEAEAGLGGPVDFNDLPWPL